MAKKNWFSLLKRIFTSKGKKGKSRRWVFGKPKIRRLAPVSASPPSRGRPQGEGAEEEQSLETAEFFQLTTSPISTHQFDDENWQISVVEELAATKIQTAFRGYLARKALRALKGLVRLQAIVRGRAVRRHAITTLKRLQSVVNIQSQVCARRCEIADRTSYFHEHKESPVFRGKDIKIDSNSQRRWDDSILTKQEEYALSSSKREAAIKRERIKEYAFNHRMSTETEQNKANRRWRYWLEQWVETRLAKSEDFQDPKNGYSSQSKNNEESGDPKLKSTKFQKQYLIQRLNSPLKAPRRSFHRKQHSIGEDDSFTRTPTVPTYMAATESAKARSRSMSSPRLRPVNLDYYSDSNSPYKYKFTPISPINKEVTSNRRSGNPSHGSSQYSPSLRDFLGPVRSNTLLKDQSVDSLFSLPNWDTSRR